MVVNTSADEPFVRRTAMAGAVAPILFWGVLIVLAVLHGTIDVSGHQLLRFGWLMYVGFFGYGALTLLFVWGLRRRMPRSRRSSFAIGFLTLWGCGPLLGTFTMGTVESWHAWLHFTGFLLMSLAPIIALPLFGSAVWGAPPWRPFGPLSVIWGVAVAVVVFLPALPTQGYALWTGPGSMLDIFMTGAWLIVTSRRLAQLAGQLSQETSAGETADNALTEDPSSTGR